MPSPAEIARLSWEGLEQDPQELHLEYFDESVELLNPPQFPVTGPFRGHEGVRRWAGEIWEVLSDYHTDIEEQLEPDSETVVDIVRTRGRMRHTGLEADLRWAVVWRFREGKVVRVEGFFSLRDALRAAGLRDDAGDVR